jgi:hypothetical protein
MPRSHFDWNGNQGSVAPRGRHYRDPGNPNFSSVGGVARWLIPGFIALVTVPPLVIYLIVQAVGLFLPTRY